MTLNRREMMTSLGGLVAGATPVAKAFAQMNAAGGPDVSRASGPSVKEIARRRGIIAGASADPHYLQNPAFAQFLATNFDMLTPGNEMKWGGVHPARSAYNFTGGDAVMAFAEGHGMKVHGHNLCWNILNPGWVTATVNKTNARAILEEHIMTVAGHYRGRIDSWDVVNEPVRINAKRPDGLSTGPWLDNLGPEYLDIAFNATKAADPTAIRVLNLDNAEQASQIGDAVRKASLQLVRDMVKRGVPVQAIGLESHLQTAFPIQNEDRTNFIKAIKDLGLEVMLTELDIDDTSTQGPDDARRAVVAKAYYDYLHDVLPVSKAKRVMFWSFTDKDNWYDFGARYAAYLRRPDGSGHLTGLITADAQPAPALEAIKEALRTA